jgi:hypothetical protein
MKRALPLLIAISLLLGALAQAQEQPTIASLDISLWPEYDRPEMLVIYRGLLAADTPLPVLVEIPIPASAGAPSAVAYVDESGNRFNQAYTTRTEGDTLVVSFELATVGFQIEYYDGLSYDEGESRQYAFVYTAGYEIVELTTEFQVPPTARSFDVEPPASSVQPLADGLTYHTIQQSQIAPGEQVSWTVTYEKDNELLTAAAATEATAPVAPATIPTTPEGAGNSTAILFVIAFVGLAAVGAAAFWLGRRTQPLPEPAPGKKQKRRGSGRGDSGGRGDASFRSPGPSAVYCHQCGARLRADSVFCHRCGAPVREPEA